MQKKAAALHCGTLYIGQNGMNKDELRSLMNQIVEGSVGVILGFLEDQPGMANESIFVARLELPYPCPGQSVIEITIDHSKVILVTNCSPKRNAI